MRRIIEELEPAQRRSFYVLLTLTSLIGAVILFIVIVKFKEPFASFIIALFGFGALAMVSTACYSIIKRSSKHAWIIIRLIVGVHILLPIVYLFLMLSLSTLHDLRTEARRYDLSAEIPFIESIEIVKAKQSFYGSHPLEEFEYTVICEVDESEWPKLLDELKTFDFKRPFGDPRHINKDAHLILISFSEPRDGVTQLFIGAGCTAEARIASSGEFILQTDSMSAIKYNEFVAFVDGIIAH